VKGSLAHRIAVVVDGGEPLGRAMALALAARGARVVVAGRRERALGETVGEVAYMGGQGRHVVGGVDEAVARAEALWGPVDLVVETGLDPGGQEPR
jgi:NAD(P)-dependent dehydrogenase (short-subunit alcohol dehydrogenase family)